MAKKAFMIVGSYLAGLFSFFLVYKILALLLVSQPDVRAGLLMFILCGIVTRHFYDLLGISDCSIDDFNDAAFSDIIALTGYIAKLNALACASFAPIYILVELAIWIFYYDANGYIIDPSVLPDLFGYCEGVPLDIIDVYSGERIEITSNGVQNVPHEQSKIIVSSWVFLGSACLPAAVLYKLDGN